jgi:hypothetical protein
LKSKHPVKEGRTVEEADFEEAEVEKLEFVKSNMGLKTNKAVIKALIFQKFNEIKLRGESC